jgi:hypothetical protein
MKRSIQIIAIAIIALLNVKSAKSQDTELALKLTDPLKPGKLNVELFNGSIKIVGYSGKEVLVTGDGPYLPGKGDQMPVRDNTKKVSDFVSQESNQVKIKVGKPYIMNLVVRVPRNFSLVLKTLTAGNIDVQKVDGDHEISVISGNIVLSDVNGSVLANNVKGEIKVDIGLVKMNAPLALSSVTGSITLILPASQKANVKLQTDFAGVYSDFDIDKDSTVPKSNNMAHRTTGKINGGGTEIFIKTVGGNIYLRKKKVD